MLNAHATQPEHYCIISYHKTLQSYYFTKFLDWLFDRGTVIEQSLTTTAVRKCRYIIIKQSTLEHNLDFENMILSIRGWIF